MTAPDEQLRRSPVQTALMICVCLTFFSLPVGTAPLTICSLASLAIWLFSGQCYTSRADWLGQDWFRPLAALFILPWLGIVWSSAQLSQSFDLAQRSHYWLFALVSFAAMKSEDSLKTMLACFITGTSLVAAIVMLYFYGFIPETAYLQKFQFIYYINFSLFLVISILLLAYFYRFAVWPRNILIGGLMLFLALTITCLKGRSAYLSLLLLSPWMFTVLFRRYSTVAVLVAVLLTIALMATSGTVRTRLALIPKEIQLFMSGSSSTYQLPDGTSTPSSIGLRIRMWKNAATIFKNHPLIGAGTAGYKHETDKLDPSLSSSHPHSSYLYVATSYGVLGIGLYSWLLVITLRRGWRSRHSLSGHTILAFVLVILIGSLTDTQILTVSTGVALGFIVGIPTKITSLCAS